MRQKIRLTRHLSGGFTIVELLIVIVVIGILATIVYVSYQGTQTYSRNQSAATTASTVKRKIEAYAEITNAYPNATTASAYMAALNSYGDSSLSIDNLAIGSPNDGNGTTTVQVSQCASQPGMAYQIRYWDFGAHRLASTIVSGSVGGAACTSWTVLS